MDNQQIAVKLIFEHLGLKFKMNTFNDRLILQKTIYLVQEAGFNLGYHFSWYLKGPYSTSLASDGFSIQDEIRAKSNEFKKWKLDDKKTELLNALKDDWFVTANEHTLAHRLELFASIHFLIKRKNINPNNYRQLFETLISYGKIFTEEEVTKAAKELLQHGVLN